jgi:uncharacterized membrane protein YccC
MIEGGGMGLVLSDAIADATEPLHAEIARLRTELADAREVLSGMDEIVARLRRELEASENGHKKAREAQLIDYKECQRLRREKEALVEALKTVRKDLAPNHYCDVRNANCDVCNAVYHIDAALRSATETKDGQS